MSFGCKRRGMKAGWMWCTFEEMEIQLICSRSRFRSSASRSCASSWELNTTKTPSGRLITSDLSLVRMTAPEVEHASVLRVCMCEVGQPDFLSSLFLHTSTRCLHSCCWCHIGIGSSLWEKSHPRNRKPQHSFQLSRSGQHKRPPHMRSLV